MIESHKSIHTWDLHSLSKKQIDCVLQSLVKCTSNYPKRKNYDHLFNKSFEV